MQILQAVLSGNLAGALQDVGAMPSDAIDCESGICEVNPVMDAGPAANNGPDPGAVLNSMKQYVKAQISNCYNGFHQTTFGKGVQAFSALALFPIASNSQSNQIALGAEVVGKLSVVAGSNSAGAVLTPLLESFTANVTTPLYALGTGLDAGAYLLCSAGAATSIHP